MNPETATFRRFYTIEQAVELALFLEEHSISSETTTNDEAYAAVGAGGYPVVTHDVNIARSSFAQAEALLLEHPDLASANDAHNTTQANHVHPKTSTMPKSASITTFRRYQVAEHAQETAAYLRSHGIHVEILDTAPAVDLTFTGGSGPITHDVSIPEADFTKAEALMLERVNDEVGNAASDHYLYGFSDNELLEVLVKSDEWSAYDYTLARKILKERGKAISEDELEVMKKERMATLAQPEANTPIWIFAGYALALVGGFLGILMGLLIWTMKKTLPNGERVYTYTPRDRRHGRNIFFIGILMFILIPVVYYGGFIEI